MKCAGTIRAMVSLAACLIGISGASSRAQQPKPARRIAHGFEISADAVGPAAAGYGTLRRFEGGVIKDGKAYPFATEIAQSATYDGFKVEGPHLLIEGVQFSKALDIETSRPVVLRGVSVRAAQQSPWAALVRPQAGPFYFLWSDAGAATTEGAPHDRAHAMNGALQIRNGKSAVYRSHVSKTSDGIDISGADAVIAESLIDELTAWDGDHSDAIQLAETARDVRIVHNRIVNANPQTSCLYLLGRDVLVEGNYLSGGGWTVYGGSNGNGHKTPSAIGITFVQNIFGQDHFPKGGHFGAITYWDAMPGLRNIWKNNRFGDGAPVEP